MESFFSENSVEDKAKYITKYVGVIYMHAFFQVFRAINQTKMCLILILIPIPTTIVEAILQQLKRPSLLNLIYKNSNLFYKNYTSINCLPH